MEFVFDLDLATTTSSRVLGTPVDTRGNASSVPSSIKAGSIPAVSVGGEVARRSGGAGALSPSRVSQQRDSGASEGCPVGGSPPDMLSEGEGAGVSGSQATPPSPDVSPSVSAHGIPVTCSSSVPPSAPPSDFPLLGCSRTGGSFPLFHVLRSSSGLPLGQLNPFALRRSVARVLGIQFPDISKLRDGAILVKTPTFAMSQALSRVSSLIGAPVVSEPHRSLNSSKGTLYSVEYTSWKEEDILWELQADGVPVSHVYRFLDRRGSSPVGSPRLLLTFDVPHPPSYVYLGFTRLSVRHFIPRPRRCFRCQLFGHSLRTCRRQATCSHCGKLPHRPCPNPPACVNCGGPHPSDFSHCPSYLFEKTALEIQAVEKLTIQSARQRARELPYRDGLSYADVLDRGVGSSRPGRRVRFSPSLSSPAPASAASEFISPKRTSVYSPSAVTTLTTSNRFAPIASTVPLMEGSLLEDHSPPRSEVSKRPNSSPLSQRHTKRGGGSRPGAPRSRASASSSQVVAGAGTQPRSPVPSISVSPSPPLPERSHSSAAADSLDSAPKGIHRSSPPPASQALDAVGPAVGDASVSAPSVVPTVPCSQGAPSDPPGFWERPPPTAPSPQSSDMLVDHSYSSDSLSSGYSLLGSPPPGGSAPSLHPSS